MISFGTPISIAIPSCGRAALARSYSLGMDSALIPIGGFTGGAGANRRMGGAAMVVGAGSEVEVA
ncbi:hypothetical protein GCM10011348_14470 [Marinobacterium nitratireducens]|uniref:Uncharacterized protein n=1 Tax=Marinobacterium nitratireducens TaxID=518897 RepID=A0A918DQM6_9GAMM|nr:hypothetical protein GCM10011348_14470 [Marinobacterium nitratireducens]